MRARRGLASAIAAGAALAACARPSGGAVDAGGPPFEARPQRSGLELVNRDTAPVLYMIFEHRVAMLVNWRPCGQRGICREVPPRDRLLVPYDSIMGYQADARELIVYWWQLRRAPGDSATRVDSVRSVSITLPSDGAVPRP